MIFSPKNETIVGASIVSSSLFIDVNVPEHIISGSCLMLYELYFKRCNINCDYCCIYASDEARMLNTILLNSSGIAASTTQKKPISIEFALVLDSTYSNPIKFESVPTTLVNANFTRCSSEYIFSVWQKAYYLNTQFLTFLDNNCTCCGTLEAGVEGMSTNKRHQYVRNRCSNYLFISFNTNCYCDWFYFINNYNNQLNFGTSHLFVFTNSFSTNQMSGQIQGSISIIVDLEQPPFPYAVMPAFLTKRCLTKLPLTAVLVNLFIFIYIMFTIKVIQKISKNTEIDAFLIGIKRRFLL